MTVRDPYWASDKFPAPLKVDLGAGRSKREGFVGLDRAPVTDICHDLLALPWPFADESVDELHASHLLEHFTGEQQILILDESFRVLKHRTETVPGMLTIIVPGWNSARMWQDPTHKAPFPAEKTAYFNKAWREANRLEHYGITADFDCEAQHYQILDPHPASGVRGYSASPREAQMFALYYYNNVLGDLTLIMRKNRRG